MLWSEAVGYGADACGYFDFHLVFFLLVIVILYNVRVTFCGFLKCFILCYFFVICGRLPFCSPSPT